PHRKGPLRGVTPEEVDGRRSFAPPGSNQADPAAGNNRRQCHETDYASYSAEYCQYNRSYPVRGD
ncbi:hypothetical protein D0V87_23485, partial [Salmonella enterica]|nr:hypothetical protein [Salmonella enterica]EBL0994336.1 hypothetical protein [Salmonella enterica]